LGESTSGSGPPATNDPAISNLDPFVAGRPHRIAAISAAVNHDVDRDRPFDDGPVGRIRSEFETNVDTVVITVM
jgi:hypothetical protein